MDNDDGIDVALAKARKELKAKRALLISVSAPFANVADGYMYPIVILPKPGKVFYIKVGHFKSMFEIVLKKQRS